MRDSFVDQAEDEASGDDRYVAHYASRIVAKERVDSLVRRSTAEARRLRNGHRHAVITACMVAMRTPETRASSASIVRAGGSLTRELLPILRAWRIAFAQQGA